MPVYEGLVASLLTDGKAEVVIRPGKPGIPGAPELTEKVCHCATNGSIVRIEALNRAGARVGDRVCLSRRGGILMRNAAALLGFPVLGGMSGLVASAIFAEGLAVHVTGAVVSTAVGLLLGVIIGGVIYRRSANDQAVISRIIRTRTDMASMLHGNPSRTP
ncbi:MAG: hypothetical protein AMK69_09710 [Nitrospira bacterium SG8_3]|jgi:hypothetical protein|nr:MAG: hypothetical protein AMK69_09710 [Nitrospira bacterium SG8_3]